jgi:hypothetical protein
MDLTVNPKKQEVVGIHGDPHPTGTECREVPLVMRKVSALASELLPIPFIRNGRYL